MIQIILSQTVNLTLMLINLILMYISNPMILTLMMNMITNFMKGSCVKKWQE